MPKKPLRSVSNCGDYPAVQHATDRRPQYTKKEGNVTFDSHRKKTSTSTELTAQLQTKNADLHQQY